MLSSTDDLPELCINKCQPRHQPSQGHFKTPSSKTKTHKHVLTYARHKRERERRNLAADDGDGGKSLPEGRQGGAAAAVVAEDRASALNPVDQADQALHGGHATGRGSGPTSGARARVRIRMDKREHEDECGDGDGDDGDGERDGAEKRESYLRCLLAFLNKRLLKNSLSATLESEDDRDECWWPRLVLFFDFGCRTRVQLFSKLRWSA